MTAIRAVFFDVGETLVDESREYGTWADWLGVPRHTFSAVFGAVIGAGGDYRKTFGRFRPGFDLAIERARRADAGAPETFGPDDLYPDVVSCLAKLRSAGMTVGVAGNQTERAEVILRSLDLPVDVVGTSAGWGVEKPSGRFFERVVAEAGVGADEVLYVGDRLDNDIAPAQRSGLATALLRRGPWGNLLADVAVEAACLFDLDSLDPLPGLLLAHNAHSEGQGSCSG